MKNPKAVIGPTLAAMALLATVTGARAATDERSYLVLDGYLVQDKERIPEKKLGYGGRIGLGTPLTGNAFGPLDLEIGIFANPIKRKSGGDGQQGGAMVDIVQNFDLGGIDPFIFAGLGAVSESLFTFDGRYFAIEAGAGAALTVLDPLKVRASLSLMDVRNSDIDPSRNGYLDYRFNVGLLLPFGGAKAAPVKAAPKVVDSDGDGIPDAQDRCPSAAAPTADGCPAPAPVAVEPPKDTDGDGVPDAQDSCPGTLAGAKVDTRGCLVAANIVLKGVTFVTGSSKLTPEASAVLDNAAIALAGQPDVKVEIGGHTDSLGDAKKNTALSQARADAVRKYLVGKGIDGGRLTAKGYGSSKPIADNKTKEGRAENRRVELKVVE